MKKLIALVVAVLTLFAFGSCFASDETAETSDDQKEYEETVEKSDDQKEYMEEIKRMQSDIYDIMKQSIYDKLDGSMSYSYVQNSMDNAERQIKTKISTFSISLDISNGMTSPKWICSVRVNDGNIYPLIYISVDLDSTYYLKHKYIGTYNID